MSEAHAASTADDGVVDLLKPPATLYHYTTAEGLRSILESGSLWATDVAYLNDSKELQYGLEYYKAAVRKEAASDEKVVGILLDQLLGDQGSLFSDCRLMATCYCSDGDLLSQWRSYAGAGGYALGFNTERMALTIAKQLGSESPPFDRVFYGEESAKIFGRVGATYVLEKLRLLIDDMKKMVGLDEKSDESIEALAKAMYEIKTGELNRAMSVSSCLKHPAFSEEREWRSIFLIHKYGDQIKQIKFRQGNWGLTPYISIDIKDADGHLPLSEIVVGPGRDAELRTDAVRLMLEVLGYEDTVQVRASVAPFRTS